MAIVIVLTEWVGGKKQVKVFVDRAAACAYFGAHHWRMEMENAELVDEVNAGGFPEGSLAKHLSAALKNEEDESETKES